MQIDQEQLMIFRHNIFSDPAPVNKKALFIIFMCLFILSSIIALNFINNGRIVVKHVSVTITALPKNLENFRILHISDLHGKEFGASQSTISTMLRQQHYNAVCITGDVCRPDGDYDAFIKLIDLFSVPVYFVAGGEDPDPIAAVSQQSENVKAQYILEAEEHGAIYLDHPEKTILAEVNFGEMEATGTYVCSVCGYVYDPAEHDGVAFEDLPDDWKCPRCKQPKEKFNKA